jgi:tryptophan synthase alpha chain
MADGPIVQAAHIRALNASMSVSKTLEMVREFRSKNVTTPIVLMGYYNPIYIYGGVRFAKDAAAAGIDGVLIVDLPPEEDGEIKGDLKAAGIDLIRLITPTSTGERLKKLVTDASGFLYYVSITGVTGTTAINVDDVAKKLKEIKTVTDLPIAVGFGIRTPEDAKSIGQIAEGVVIGSAFVHIIEKTVPNQIVSEIRRQVTLYRNALA